MTISATTRDYSYSIDSPDSSLFRFLLNCVNSIFKYVIVRNVITSTKLLNYHFFYDTISMPSPVSYVFLSPFGQSSITLKNNLLNPDYILRIKNSRLGGNNVTGDLTLFEGNSHTRPVYVWYSEETFDDNYKSQYPQFFISKDAPEELREKYYNPKIIYETTNEQDGIIIDLKEKNEDTKILVRQTLTLDEYLKYYKFLKGKYLGNFFISPQDLLQIETIEKYGLEQRDEIIKDITNMMNNINQTTDCENHTINEQEEKGVSLTLKHK